MELDFHGWLKQFETHESILLHRQSKHSCNYLKNYILYNNLTEFEA